MSNVVDLKSVGEYLLINWGAYMRQGSASGLGFKLSLGCSSITSGSVPVDERKAQDVERALLQLQKFGDDKSMLLFNLAKCEYVLKMNNSKIIKILGIKERAFYSLKVELIWLLAGTTLKKTVDTAQRAA